MLFRSLGDSSGGLKPQAKFLTYVGGRFCAFFAAPDGYKARVHQTQHPHCVKRMGSPSDISYRNRPNFCYTGSDEACYHYDGTVFCFVGAGREIDTRPFLEGALRDAKRLCVPLCVSMGVMELRQIDASREIGRASCRERV